MKKLTVMVVALLGMVLLAPKAAEAACHSSCRTASFDIHVDTNGVVISSNTFIWTPANAKDCSTCDPYALNEDDNWLPNLRQQTLVDAGRVPAVILSFNSSEIFSVQVSTIAPFNTTVEPVSVGGGLQKACLAKVFGCYFGKVAFDNEGFERAKECSDDVTPNASKKCRNFNILDGRCSAAFDGVDSNGSDPGWCN